MVREGKETDRRVKKTRLCLKDAFVSLIAEKDYDAITIADITDRANYNRATFYVHYLDKEDLLTKLIEEVLNSLEEKFATPPADNLFSSILDHAHLYKALLGNTQLREFFHRRMFLSLKKHFAERVTLLTYNDENMSSEPEIYYAYAGSAVLGMIEYWYKNNFNHSPSYMAQQLEEIANQRPHRIVIR